MKRKTKIICTIGPSSEEQRIVEKMLHAGMNIARFNFSHGSHETHEKRIETVRSASKKTGIPVALLLDTKGPQIRTSNTENNNLVELKTGRTVELTSDPIQTTEKRISVNYKNLSEELKSGMHVLLADGLIDLEVKTIIKDTILCTIVAGGTIGSYKNVNIPEIVLSLPIVTDQDIADIDFGIRMNMDYLAASFVQTAQDIEILQNILDEKNSRMKIVAKIETKQSLKNIQSIANLSEGIMVARGDLGVQLPIEDVPLDQKKIIRICNQGQKAVITATQMLESMITNIRPTRAEVSDVANAIFDGTDAVMLSGETAVGQFPVQSVETMHNVALKVEDSKEYQQICQQRYEEMYAHTQDPGSSMAKSAYLLAKDLHASAILAPSLRGNSPKMISKFRPLSPIIAPTPDDQTLRHLLLYWGTYPLKIEKTFEIFEELLESAIDIAIQHKIIKKFDSVIITAGIPLKKQMMLNIVQVHFLGEILQRSRQGLGENVLGTAILAWNQKDIEKAIKEVKTPILICKELTTEYLSLIPLLKGIIVKQPIKNFDLIKEKYTHITIIADIVTDIRSFIKKLRDKQPIGISGEKKIVFHITEDDYLLNENLE